MTGTAHQASLTRPGRVCLSCPIFAPVDSTAARRCRRTSLVQLDSALPVGGKRRDWEVIGGVEFLAAPRGEQPEREDSQPSESVEEAVTA